MLNIWSVYQGIANAVNGAALQVGTLQVTATPHMPLYPTVPHFYPFNFRINYDKTSRGGSSGDASMTDLNTTWHLCLSLSADDAGHEEASKLAGAGESTIRAAINAARGEPSSVPTALGGAAGDVHLKTASGPNLVNISETTQLLVIEFNIYVVL